MLIYSFEGRLKQKTTWIFALVEIVGDDGTFTNKLECDWNGLNYHE